MRTKLKLLASTTLLCVLSTASLARAQDDDDDDEPATPTVSAAPSTVTATPPEPPKVVPPPVVERPATTAKGTTSPIYVQGDDHVSGRHAFQPVVYRNGRIMIRDPAGIFELSPGGLLQFDVYSYQGPGVQDYQRPNGTGLKTGLLARRARVELSGRVLQKWYFLFGLQAGNENALANPDPRLERGPASTVAPLNNFIGYEHSTMFRVQVGQFRVPFTMENVTGIRWNEFMERSLSVRTLGAPLIRDLGAMVWGGTDRSAIWYALGYFGGEGGNRPSTDNRGDVMGRLVLRPLWKQSGSIGQAHVGLSGRYGRRDRNYAQYDAPFMSTPGGYVFWSPVYGTGAGETHVQPSNEQSAFAAELYVPFSKFDLRGEVVVARDGRREVLAATRNNTERAGTLTGYGWYAQATWWPFGPPQMVGAPGNIGQQTVDHSTKRAVAIAVRYEQLRARYDSTSRSDGADGAAIPGVRRGELDAQTDRIRVDAVQVAATYWATRHIRLTLEWSLYTFPDVPVGFPNAGNQATAPGAKPNADAADRANNRTLHEISARVQLSF